MAINSVSWESDIIQHTLLLHVMEAPCYRVRELRITLSLLSQCSDSQPKSSPSGYIWHYFQQQITAKEKQPKNKNFSLSNGDNVITFYNDLIFNIVKIGNILPEETVFSFVTSVQSILLLYCKNIFCNSKSLYRRCIRSWYWRSTESWERI